MNLSPFICGLSAFAGGLLVANVDPVIGVIVASVGSYIGGLMSN